VEKTQFVVTHLDEDSLSLKEALFLIKVVEFNFANQACYLNSEKLVKINVETPETSVVFFFNFHFTSYFCPETCGKKAYFLCFCGKHRSQN
jgi:hypothetical protein